MVKKDLERVGIKYKTPEGVADFHAAGRHTYITQLLLNGASLPEAKELARHSDVKMTMRYTHVGINDQARALKALPICQDIVRKPADFPCPDESASDFGCHNGVHARKIATDGTEAPCDTEKHKKAPSDADGAQWRRRESNPRAGTFWCGPLRA